MLISNDSQEVPTEEIDPSFPWLSSLADRGTLSAPLIMLPPLTLHVALDGGKGLFEISPAEQCEESMRPAKTSDKPQKYGKKCEFGNVCTSESKTVMSARRRHAP